MANETTLKQFEEMGGRAMLLKVNKVFYDKIYAHPWIGLFFEHVDQEYIEMQQTNFMQATLGGENIYGGKTPVFAHSRIRVTEPLFDLREKLLLEALDEVGANDKLKTAWIRIDNKFKRPVLDKAEEDAKNPSPIGDVMDFPCPRGM